MTKGEFKAAQKFLKALDSRADSDVSDVALTGDDAFDGDVESRSLDLRSGLDVSASSWERQRQRR